MDKCAPRHSTIAATAQQGQPARTTRRREGHAPYNAVRATAQRPDGLVAPIHMERGSVDLERAHRGRSRRGRDTGFNHAPGAQTRASASLGVERRWRAPQGCGRVCTLEHELCRRVEVCGSVRSGWHAPCDCHVRCRRTRVLHPCRKSSARRRTVFALVLGQNTLSARTHV